jgi:branched-chain amino acid transport system ATP-binding protein
MSVLENVLISFTPKVKYGLGGMLLRSGHYYEEERKIYEKAIDQLRVFNLEGKADWVAENCPTASSASWRSPRPRQPT